MSYMNPGSGDPSAPGGGPIYRWGNDADGGPYLGCYRLEKGPMRPADKNVWSGDVFQ